MILYNSQLQLGTVTLAGCPGVRLVGKSCLSVCPRWVWPYLRNGSSDQLRFWRAAEGRQAR